MSIFIRVLMFFDGGLEGIIKTFTKLDQKLDAHILKLQTRDEVLAASAEGIAAARKALSDEAARAARIKKTVNNLIA